MKEEEKVCSLCGDVYAGFGNNAWPFKGRCCDACNWTEVVPARLLKLKEHVDEAA